MRKLEKEEKEAAAAAERAHTRANSGRATPPAVMFPPLQVQLADVQPGAAKTEGETLPVVSSFSAGEAGPSEKAGAVA